MSKGNDNGKNRCSLLKINTIGGARMDSITQYIKTARIHISTGGKLPTY